MHDQRLDVIAIHAWPLHVPVAIFHNPWQLKRHVTYLFFSIRFLLSLLVVSEKMSEHLLVSNQMFFNYTITRETYKYDEILYRCSLRFSNYYVTFRKLLCLNMLQVLASDFAITTSTRAQSCQFEERKS